MKYNKEEMEKFILAGLEESDARPIGDLIRDFLPEGEVEPTEDDFLEALKFLEDFLKKYNVSILESLDSPTTSNKRAEDIINELHKKWFNTSYSDLYFRYWFTIHE